MGTVALAPTLFERLGAEPTLDELIMSVWDGLAAQRVVECPVCEGEMIPEYGAHARPFAGRCTSCGVTLR